MAPETSLPAQVGPYRPVAQLAEGGMGVVYRAVHADGTVVALKRMRADLDTEALSERFLREANVTLEHDNIVRTLDAGIDGDGQPYIAFELLEGETLRERLARGPLSVDEVFDLGLQLSAGLAAAHEAGIVHRDVKPSNIFLCADGEAKLLDFGIALFADLQTRLTVTGGLVGTPGYLSPEQAEGLEQVDARTDVWSLGVLLVESLTGHPPFKKESPLATVVAILMGPVPRATDMREDCPVSLARAIDRCLQRTASNRFSSCHDLHDALLEARKNPALSSSSGTSNSIVPGEERIVVLVLAEGVGNAAPAMRLIEKEGGVAQALVGGRLLGIFGARATLGDEMMRALSAARDLCELVDRVSLSAGRANSQGEEIAGTALQAAERACKVAVRGIAIDRETRGNLPTHLPVKEHTDGVFCVEPSAITDKLLSQPTFDALLVGRTIELALLDRSVTRFVETDASAVVIVSGALGIGKSRLLAECQAALTAKGVPQIFTASALAHSRQSSYGLIASLIRAAGAELPWLDAQPVSESAPTIENSDVIGAPPATDPQLFADRARMAITDWFRDTIDRGPVAFLVEDLHWTDRVSLSLLEEMMLLFHQRLFVVATSREELWEAEEEPFLGADVTKVPVGPLSSTEVDRLVQETSSALSFELPLETRSAVRDLSDGNPFFAQQIVRAVMDEGNPAGADIRLPSSVEAALQSRLDHLPAAEKELCKNAAVIGRPFLVEELAPLMDHSKPELHRLLVSTVRRDIFAPRITPQGERLFWFRSAIFGDVAYRLLSAEKRAEQHLRCARFFEHASFHNSEEVARHFEAANRPASAAEHYAQACLRAMRRGDAPTVLATSDKAFELLPTLDNKFELHMARQDALRFLGRGERRIEELNLGLSVAPNDEARAMVLSERCIALLRVGKPELARTAGRAAVVLAKGVGGPDVNIVALSRLALVETHAGRQEEAAKLLAEANVHMDQASEFAQTTHLECQARHGSRAGDLGKRKEFFSELRKRHEASGDVRRNAGAASNLADVYNRVGAYEDAERELREALELCRKVNHRVMEGYVLLNLGHALGFQGNAEGAESALDEASAIASQMNESRLALLTKIYRARARMLVNAEEALELAASASKDAERAQLPGLRAAAEGLWSQSALLSGDPELALAHSELAFRLCQELGGLEEDEAEVYLAHARALTSMARLPEATKVAQAGIDRVQAIAMGISDVELRTSFLERVSAHRELREIAEG